MKSVMNHNFSQIPDVRLQRSKFNRSHGHKTCFDAGNLVPIFVDEALPGDTFNLTMSCFGRLSTPLVPIMDNLYMDSFFFAVPMRLLWSNWEKFNGAQDNPADSTDFTIPVIKHTTAPMSTVGFEIGTLGDYFGMPTDISGLENISVMFHRAYNLIYNEWFRDQNLIDSAAIPVGDGPDELSYYPIRKRGKRHDYFTSCLPWAQKGDAVELPLGTSAPVIGDGASSYIHRSSGADERYLATANTAMTVDVNSAWTGAEAIHWGKIADGSDTGLEADLSSATASTINALRQAFQIQRLYERDARAGTRYIEVIRSHFGVTSADARLQRPEYLGGGRTPININPIAQTESSDASTPQGTLTAMGTLSASGHGFIKSFTEHCIIMGIVCVIADLTYQQGLNRMFSRSTRWDFFWPSLSNIGEQSVLSKEIWVDGSANDEDVFGYQERYAEYRYKPSQITNIFRSDASGSIDKWHLSQDFATRPTLNQTFIEEAPPVSRVVATPSEPEIIFDSYFDLKCVRPMPVYSVPGFIDHF